MDTKFCSQCGAPIRAEAKFCPNCGADLSSISTGDKNQPARADEKKEPPDKEKPKDDTVLLKKILIPIGCIIGIVIITGIVLISLFISRSCSSRDIAGPDGNITDSGTAYFDIESPGLAEQVSPDQLAILSVDGPPQAYTIYIDPASGSVIEQWSYYLLGREINFLDGIYTGGVEVPPPDSMPDLMIPQLVMYPWEILNDFSPEAVIRETGTAIFNTSALVLPGWNDGYEIARLWLLSGGGNMITVDGRLAMLDIDPGEALDLDQFAVNDFLVGTLIGDNTQLGVILSPDSKTGSYQLSISPRGQGTTQDGTGIIFELTGTDIERTFVIGKDAKVSISGIDGSVIIPEASGALAIEKYDNGYTIAIDASINGQDYMLAGYMGSAVWKNNDPSTIKAIGEVPGFIGDNPGLISEGTELDINTDDESEDEAEVSLETDRVLVFKDTFDSNENGWPVSYGEEKEGIFYQSDIFQDKYLVFVQQKKEGEYFVERFIDKTLDQVFTINIDILQQGAGISGGGLALSDRNGTDRIYFLVLAGEGNFLVVKKDSSGLKYLLDHADSNINPLGEINTLTIYKEGPDHYFFINDLLVAKVIIEGFAVDRIGMVAKPDPDEPITCYFDDLEIYDLN